MPDTITYFGDPKRATYADGTPIVVNGRPLLIPENFDLQKEINAASYASTNPIFNWFWYRVHHALGSGGDPQRRAGYWGGFDPRYTDAGNYSFGLSAAAAGISLDKALEDAAVLNKAGTGKDLPKVNENAIRQAYDDFAAKRFRDVDRDAGASYFGSNWLRDFLNAPNTPLGFLNPSHLNQRDVERYALDGWGNLDSPEAKAFMANFEQAFGSYPQHLDLDKLHPLPADGRIPSGKDVSLFVGRNGEVLFYEREPAPVYTGALRGIYGLDGSPGDTKSLPGVAGLERRPKDSGHPGLPDPGIGSGGMMFFDDGTPRPESIRPHPATPGDPTGGVDITLKDGSKEHWWNDQIDGFIRSKISPFDGGAPAVPFLPPAGVAPNPVQPDASPRPGDATQGDPRNIRVLSRINPQGTTPSLPADANTPQQASRASMPDAPQSPGDTTQDDPRNIRVLRRVNPPGATSSLPDNANTPQPAAGPRVSSAVSPCPTIPCRRGSSVCPIELRQVATTWTIGTRGGSGRFFRRKGLRGPLLSAAHPCSFLFFIMQLDSSGKTPAYYDDRKTFDRPAREIDAGFLLAGIRMRRIHAACLRLKACDLWLHKDQNGKQLT